MKVICQGLDLYEALNKVSKALPAKNINAVLEGIKITAKNDSIILYATDLDLSIQKKIPADVLMEGEAVVQGRKINDLMRTLTSEQIELSINEKNQLKIKYTDSEAAIPCYKNEEYPETEYPTESEKLSIVSSELKELINKTLFAVSADENRPALKGCLYEVEEFSLKAIALDGYRLAMATKPLEKKAQKMSMIVPAKSLNELSKMLDGDDTIVTLKIQKNLLVVDFEHTVLTTRLLSGDFINYKQIIPTEFNTKIITNKEQMETAVERASIFAKGDKNNLVKLDVKEKLMTISSISVTDEGRLQENMSVNLEGRDISIAFNARFISDCLKATNDEFIKMNFTSAVAPCIITPCEGEDFLYLILPVRMV